MFVLGVGENGALWHRGNEGSQLPEERDGEGEREGEGGRGKEKERGRERLKMSVVR